MPDSSTLSWYQHLPKVELHLHLEGAIPLDALWQLIQKYGGDPSVPTLEALKQRFVYRDFKHFIDTWVWKNNFLRHYEDFTIIAEAVARNMARQNIRYAEVFFSPPDFARHGLETQGLAQAIRTGLNRVSEVEIALIPDVVRDFGPERAARTVEEAAEVKELGVIGIGLGGSEDAYPPEPFAPIFERARQLGLHTTAHAGEAAGAGSIWGAIRSLKVERIGHGTHAEEDEALLAYFAEHNIPLEMCPISNVRTGSVDSLADHPIRRYFERGLLVTVNTDDPMMFGNSLAEEYQALAQVLGFSREDIRALILQAIRASWQSDDEKQALIAAFQRDPAWAA